MNADDTGTLRGRAPRDAVIQLVGRAVNLVMGVVVTAVLARALGDEGFGQWATVLAVLMIADQLTSFGLEGQAVQFAAAEPERRDAWVGALVGVRLRLTVPIGIGTVVALLLLSEGSDMRIAGLVLAGTLLLSVPRMIGIVFQLRVRNDVAVLVTTINSLLWGAGVLLLASLEGGLVAFAIVFVSVQGLTIALQTGLALRMSSVRLGGQGARRRTLLRVGLPFGIGSLLVVAYGRIDQILLFELAGAREAGLYGAVYRIVDQAHFVPISLITSVAPLTAAAAAAKDPERLADLIATAGQALLTIALAGLALALVVSEPVVVLIFGEAFREAAKALPVLAATFVLVCLGYLAGNLVLVLRLQRRFLVIAAVGLGVNLALNLVFVPRYGFMASAWATLATEVVVVVPLLTLGLSRLERRPPAAPFVRTVAAAAVLTAALAGLAAAGSPYLLTLALAVPLYAALLIGLRAVDLAALRTLLRPGAPAT